MRITINNISFDPEAHAPALAAAGMLRGDSAHSNYILVQTRGPLTAEQQAALNAAGATILEYVPQETYLCNYAPADLEPIRALPFVTWANVYMRELKLKPSVHTGVPGTVSELLTLDALPRASEADRVTTFRQRPGDRGVRYRTGYGSHQHHPSGIHRPSS